MEEMREKWEGRPMLRPGDPRRVYYDHDPAYRKIEAAGGHGWDDLHPGHSGGSYDALLAFLETGFAPRPGPGARALDLGCGGGQAAITLAGRGYMTFAFDYSASAVRLAQRNAREAGLAVHLIVGDCLCLPFGCETMDLILDNHMLHCLVGTRDRMAFLNSARDILKPGGTLFSETMSCEGDFDAAAMEADPTTRIARSHTRYWVSRQELDQELGSAGFRVVSQTARSPEDSSGSGAHLVTYAVRPHNG